MDRDLRSGTPPRVVLLTTSFPVDRDAVSGVFVERLARSLSERMPVVVVTPAALDTVAARFDGAPFRVHAFRYGPASLQVLAHAPGGVMAALRRSRLNWLLLPQFLLAMLIACLREGRSADLIHANWSVNGLTAGIAGRLLGKPVILTLRGDDVVRADKSRLLRAILRLSLVLCDRAAAVSEGILGQVAALFPGMTAKLALIHNGVDERFLHVSRAESAGEFRMLTVGHLVPRKRVDLVIGALAALGNNVNARLTIIGDGSERQRLETMALDLGLGQRVSFLGAVPHTGIPEVFQSADLFVLASESEGMPNVLLEALAAGVPVVASDIPGTNEIIVHGVNGFLFRAGDEQALAEMIQAAAGDAQVRERVGRQGRKMIQEKGLTWAAAADKYLRLYTEVLQ